MILGFGEFITTTTSLFCLSLISASFALVPYDESASIEACLSEIYCYGDLLKTVQMSRIYRDSKTFVDMKLKQLPNDTLTVFKKWKSENPYPKPAAVKLFVDSAFDPVGSEFELWTPTDYVANPKFLDSIIDPLYKQLASDVHSIWSQLGRKMKQDVKDHPELYSAIPIKNPIIVPGGRFREYYYWDTYWIVQGLLVSEMHRTVKGMLENFSDLIRRYGFIPNGGRIYYINRSQPPLYIQMVAEYFAATSDLEFVRNNIDAMEMEFNFWMTKRTFRVKGHTVAGYGDSRSRGPRPESYYEDVRTVWPYADDADKQKQYAEIKAARESGMDFSSRWFIRNGTNEGMLYDLKCRSIVPVDLNAILYKNAVQLSSFNMLLQRNKKAKEFRNVSKKIYDAVQAVFWNESVGMWFDWDLLNNQPRMYYAASNFGPLWANCFDFTKKAMVAEKVLAYFMNEGLLNYEGGVPMTNVRTDEQWDFPNVWPPMMHMMVSGLANLGTQASLKLALEFASKWTYSNYLGFKNTQVMFEKYDCETAGKYGGGGEYTVQSGFGWSNGVLLKFLKLFGDRMSVDEGARVVAELNGAS